MPRQSDNWRVITANLIKACRIVSSLHMKRKVYNELKIFLTGYSTAKSPKVPACEFPGNESRVPQFLFSHYLENVVGRKHK